MKKQLLMFLVEDTSNNPEVPANHQGVGLVVESEAPDEILRAAILLGQRVANPEEMER